MTIATRHASTGASDTDWMQDALCAQTDPAVFFPEGRGAAITIQVRKAKKVCGNCPAKQACLEWALETGQTAGVWGGLDESERLLLRREEARKRGDGYAHCIAAQQYIEDRVKAGASQREVADELGVDHSVVGRAWRFFESERDLVQGEQVKAA